MRKILFAIIALAFGCLTADAQQIVKRYQDYVNQYKDIAIHEMRRYNIPASITLAQGILESGAGSSELCRKGNNHFGIKCHGWSGRAVYHDDDESQECFRAYDSAKESFEDHSRFLATSARYKRLFQLSRTDYKSWAYGLKECGYATNPQYAQKLIQLIELYQLHQYDSPDSKHHPTMPVQDQHIIRIYNKNLYVVAQNGDTFKSIAEEVGLSYRKLAKYNERNRNDRLVEGDIVYLKKKQKRADKAFKKTPHVVQAGESMYSIAQKYGIRLKSLYKKNHLNPDHQIKVGDRLKVY
ncbi:MAG: glucosaminidase domain-containing protein [Prevotella sp.]|nr:glucosaminidase domain-containing protein [Prevotella sp.]